MIQMSPYGLPKTTQTNISPVWFCQWWRDDGGNILVYDVLGDHAFNISPMTSLSDCSLSEQYQCVCLCFKDKQHAAVVLSHTLLEMSPVFDKHLCCDVRSLALLSCVTIVDVFCWNFHRWMREWASRAGLGSPRWAAGQALMNNKSLWVLFFGFWLGKKRV